MVSDAIACYTDQEALHGDFLPLWPSSLHFCLRHST